MKQLRQLGRYPLLVLATLFLLGTFVWDMTAPHREYSELENRYLRQRPAFSLTSLFENAYTLKYEEFVNDQFVARDGWITLKSLAESALGKIENNGIAYGKKGYLFEKANALDESRLQKNIGYLQAFTEKTAGTPVTVAIAPNAHEVLGDLVPAGLGNLPQAAYIRQVYEQTAGAAHLDLQAALTAHSSEYIFYRTDHHWTTLGAYYAYADYARSKGLEPVDIARLAPLRHRTEGFYGTHYSKAKLFGAKADSLDYYDIPITSVTIDGKEKPGLYDLEKLPLRDKYAAFIWGNNGVTVIKSQNNAAPGQKPSRVLLVKDSYGNSFAPFLTYNYDEVWVLDLRFVQSIGDLMTQNSFDDILVLYNFASFVQDTNLSKLRY